MSAIQIENLYAPASVSEDLRPGYALLYSLLLEGDESVLPCLLLLDSEQSSRNWLSNPARNEED